jgi:hypothetical protein
MVNHLNGHISDDSGLAPDLTPAPMTGKEIVNAGLQGGWENAPEGAAWVDEKRQKRRERRR